MATPSAIDVDKCRPIQSRSDPYASSNLARRSLSHGQSYAMQPKYWIVTLKPAPEMGGDAAKVIAKLLVWTEGNEPPSLGQIIQGVLTLGIASEQMAGGVTQSVDRAWPDDALRQRVATEPQWAAGGVKVWTME